MEKKIELFIPNPSFWICLDIFRMISLNLGNPPFKRKICYGQEWLGGTLALITFDQKLFDNAQELGEPLGLAEDVSYKRLLGIEVLPKDINGTIYYIGNGLTPILLSGGFYIAGKINNDYRALNKSSELIEVLLSTGVSTQIIKRITGRQSPSAAIE